MVEQLFTMFEFNRLKVFGQMYAVLPYAVQKVLSSTSVFFQTVKYKISQY